MNISNRRVVNAQFLLFFKNIIYVKVFVTFYEFFFFDSTIDVSYNLKYSLQYLCFLKIYFKYQNLVLWINLYLERISYNSRKFMFF